MLFWIVAHNEFHSEMTPFSVAGHIFLIYDVGSIQVYSSHTMARLHVMPRRYGRIIVTMPF